MAHINSTEIQTSEGTVTLTKTSTHRDYVVASVATYADGTEALLSWHLTEVSGIKFSRSTAAIQTATYNQRRHGGSAFQGIRLAPVTVKLTGKDAKDQAPELEDEPRPEDLDEDGQLTEREAAEAILDSVLPEAAKRVEATSAIVGTDNACRCGCGEATVKGFYRPGHDARHASAVAADIASSSLPYFERVTADSDLGSDALREKAHRQAEKLIAKMAKKASK